MDAGFINIIVASFFGDQSYLVNIWLTNFISRLNF